MVARTNNVEDDDSNDEEGANDACYNDRGVSLVFDDGDDDVALLLLMRTMMINVRLTVIMLVITLTLMLMVRTARFMFVPHCWFPHTHTAATLRCQLTAVVNAGVF